MSLASVQRPAPPPAEGPWTWDDFLLLEEDDPRELIDGHLIEMDLSTHLHEYTVAALIGHLYAWSLPRKAGFESGHPDLAIEVISPSSNKYDRVTKLNWYASIGVPEYWIIDPKDRTLLRMVLRDGCYVNVEALADDVIFRPASFPGLEIPLSEIWDAGPTHDGDAPPLTPPGE